MAKNSLFAILLRSSWWISALIALGVFAVARLIVPTVYAAFVPLPFVIIAALAAWRQLTSPSGARIARVLEAVRAMSWEAFSAALAGAFEEQGYDVRRLEGGEADLELTRAGRVALVACKRWKAQQTGVEPLRALHEALRGRSADECIYVTAGEVTDKARAFAAEKSIRLLHDAELARLLPRTGRRAAQTRTPQ